VRLWRDNHAKITTKIERGEPNDFGKKIDRWSEIVCVCTTIQNKTSRRDDKFFILTTLWWASFVRRHGRHDQTFASEYTDCGGQTRLSGTRAVCGVVSCCTRVCPYSVRYRVAVRVCVRCGMVRCGAVRSGAVRACVVPLVCRRSALQCRPSAYTAADLRFRETTTENFKSITTR